MLNMLLSHVVSDVADQALADMSALEAANKRCGLRGGLSADCPRAAARASCAAEASRRACAQGAGGQEGCGGGGGQGADGGGEGGHAEQGGGDTAGDGRAAPAAGPVMATRVVSLLIVPSLIISGSVALVVRRVLAQQQHHNDDDDGWSDCAGKGGLHLYASGARSVLPELFTERSVVGDKGLRRRAFAGSPRAQGRGGTVRVGALQVTHARGHLFFGYCGGWRPPHPRRVIG